VVCGATLKSTRLLVNLLSSTSGYNKKSVRLDDP
jgi:hypothetical protein